MTPTEPHRTELYVTSEIRIPLAEISFTYVRSSGPGGQNVNKVNSKACLRWTFSESTALTDPVRQRFASEFRRRITATGEVLIESQRFRDQPRNAGDCLNKLADLVRSVATAPKPRRPTRPTRASGERRLDRKKQKSSRKQLRQRPRLDD